MPRSTASALRRRRASSKAAFVADVTLEGRDAVVKRAGARVVDMGQPVQTFTAACLRIRCNLRNQGCGDPCTPMCRLHEEVLQVTGVPQRPSRPVNEIVREADRYA